MKIITKNFGEIEIDHEKIISFPSGIIGFPELTEFTLVHDEDTGVGSIHWLQSIQEPAFAMPVMDPLLVEQTYNPQIEDELLKPLGQWIQEEILVLVTVTVPHDLTQMTVNLKAPLIINAREKKACQVVIEETEYQVKFPIYEIIKRKAGGRDAGTIQEKE